MFDNYKDIFEKRGRSYHQAMITIPNARKQEFNLLLNYSDIQNGHVVCDIPSGGGYLEKMVKKKVFWVCIDPAMDFFKQRDVGSHNRKTLSKLETVALKSRSIDRLVSLAGLHHLADKQLFFAEVYRVLKNNGKFCIADVRKNSGTANFLNGFVNKYNSLGHRGKFLDHKTRDEMENCGLNLIEERVEKFFWEFDSFENMVNFCKLLFGIDGGNKEILMKGIEDHLGTQTINEKICMNWELVYYVGNKSL